MNIIYTDYFNIDFDSISHILFNVLSGDNITPYDLMYLKYNDMFGSLDFKAHIHFFSNEVH